MKKIFLASTMALALVSGSAMAVCSSGAGWKKANNGGTGGNPDITAVLSGNTVCVGSAPTWTAQEYHQSGGTLIDWKRGPSAPGNIDPTEAVGSWSIVGDQVQYIYTSGGSYTFDVYVNAPNYSFCTGTSSAADATVKTGQSACP